MDKQIKKLAWKYFRQQKWGEIKDSFGKWGSGFARFMIISAAFMQFFWMINENTGLPMCKTVAIIGLFILGFWVLVGLIALIRVIVIWLRSNWKEALKKANRQLRK